jgi:ATP/maltotriose-dependent transcriptional regulator MalT
MAAGWTQTAEVVGREEELAVLARFVDDVEQRPAALILEGDAGVGKTTLWGSAIRMARESGQRVLAAGGAPVETQMAFAGLADLLESAIDDVLPALPGPQRDALRATLLLEESPVPQGARVVSAALLTTLRELAAKTPLLVAVDDVHWLDPASADALSFAIRRLRDEQIAVLVAARTDERSELLVDLMRVPFADRVGRTTVGPLSFGAVRHLLLSRTDVRLTRPLLRRVHETSGGNPFFALELARALARREVPPEPGEPLPVPADLRRLLADSIRQLPPDTREALLVTALLARPSLETIAQAIGQSGENALGPALDANIVEFVDGAIRFAHPLLRSTIHAEAPAASRMRWHRRLVEVVSDVEERAQHLALASHTPDDTVAQQLEAAGVRARGRGAPAVAAGLLEHAVRLTPVGLRDECARRSVAAGDAWLESGERRRAIELWEEVRRTVPHGPLRADALQRLAEPDIADPPENGITLREEALREAAGDARREVDILLGLANLEHMRVDWRAAVDYATRALRVAERLGDPNVTASALTGLGIYETFLEVGDPKQRYLQAIELEARAERETASHKFRGNAYWAPQTMLSDWLRKNGELDETRSLLELQYRRALEAGDEQSRQLLCMHFADLEIVVGDFEAARAWCAEAMDLADEGEGSLMRSVALCSLAAVDAYRGDLASARSLAEEAKAIAEAAGDELFCGSARRILCFAELSAGRPDAALVELGPSLEDTVLSNLPNAGNGIEALIAVGRVDEAATLLSQLEDAARRTGLRVGRLLALRCRGLLLAATGELERALETLESAVALAGDLPLPLERGRTLLALGQARRRAKQKRAAREALEAARATFAEFGAERWVERAAAELGRIGGRTRERWELTSTERRVAELVAEGHSNKEVAAALVISVRAVEANLTRIYGKLGIRSRTELAHVLAKSVGFHIS